MDKPKSEVGPVRRTKRIRVNFNKCQIDAMETVFRQTQYPDVTVIEVLGERLGLAIEKICTWFQNRRSKFRKESKKDHIQWMRQQLFSGSEGCSGLPVTTSSEIAQHVLTPPTEREMLQTKVQAQMPYRPNTINYRSHLDSTPASPFCMSNFTSTPSPPQRPINQPFTSRGYCIDQSQDTNCTTSWSNNYLKNDTNVMPYSYDQYQHGMNMGSWSSSQPLISPNITEWHSNQSQTANCITPLPDSQSQQHQNYQNTNLSPSCSSPQSPEIISISSNTSSPESVFKGSLQYADNSFSSNQSSSPYSQCNSGSMQSDFSFFQNLHNLADYYTNYSPGYEAYEQFVNSQQMPSPAFISEMPQIPAITF